MTTCFGKIVRIIKRIFWHPIYTLTSVDREKGSNFSNVSLFIAQCIKVKPVQFKLTHHSFFKVLNYKYEARRFFVRFLIRPVWSVCGSVSNDRNCSNEFRRIELRTNENIDMGIEFFFPCRLFLTPYITTINETNRGFWCMSCELRWIPLTCEMESETGWEKKRSDDINNFFFSSFSRCDFYLVCHCDENMKKKKYMK